MLQRTHGKLDLGGQPGFSQGNKEMKTFREDAEFIGDIAVLR